MAKKINPDLPNPAITEPTEENDVKAAVTDVQPEKPAPAELPDQQVMQVLRAYAAYESLYVDRQGGAYTPDTPVSLRKETILYKNPFYKPSKSKR